MGKEIEIANEIPRRTEKGPLLPLNYCGAAEFNATGFESIDKTDGLVKK